MSWRAHTVGERLAERFSSASPPHRKQPLGMAAYNRNGHVAFGQRPEKSLYFSWIRIGKVAGENRNCFTFAGMEGAQNAT